MDKINSGLENCELDLSTMKKQLSERKSDERQVALTKNKLNGVEDKIVELQKKIDSVVSTALRGENGRVQERIMGLKNQVTECRRLIQQIESPRQDSGGFFSWIAGWFSKDSPPEELAEEDFQEIVPDEHKIREILDDQIKGDDTPVVLENQSLHSLPDDFGYWEIIKEKKSINVANNRLRELPDSIGAVTHLEHLDVSNNLLQTLPPFMGNLGRLKQLSIRGNPIGEFPDCIYRMKQLEKLDLRKTNITKIYRIDILPNLREIYIDTGAQAELYRNIKDRLPQNCVIKNEG